MQAVSDETINRLREDSGMPTEPVEPDEGADEAARAAYDAAYQKYGADLATATREMNLRILSESVSKIEFADGRTVDHVTVSQLRTLREKLGDRQILMLVNAATLATVEEPEMQPPFWQRRSKTDQT